MINISDVVITSIQELFKDFAQDVVAKYPNENVSLLVHQINAVLERLEKLPALTRDTPLPILTGFTK